MGHGKLLLREAAAAAKQNSATKVEEQLLGKLVKDHNSRFHRKLL